MHLYYTPRSHFSRKVRILLQALELDCELIDVGNVADSVQDQFGPNPLMRVPTLVDGEVTVFESDNIARYLVRTHAPEDSYEVLTEDVKALNARTVMNGIMSAEVDIILAKRTGMELESLSRYEKLFDVINSGMNWLEQHASLFEGSPRYLDFHLVSMWDHLELYDTIQMHFENLEKRVSMLWRLPPVADTAPPPA